MVFAMTQEDFKFASAMLDNRQGMIAAGKLQRWDVVKWTVTVNVALAAAGIAFWLSGHSVMSTPCPLYPHVWTAPSWQGLSSRFAALVGAPMCSACVCGTRGRWP
jgi:hypothetical protein